MSEQGNKRSEPSRQTVEAELAEHFGREHAVLVGRATTGLTLLFESLDISGEVVYPEYMCPSPVYAALYADATPRFCDVKADYTMDPVSLKTVVSEDTEAIVTVHMFGHPAQMDEIETIAAEHDVVVVEDACQSIGSLPNGDPLGSRGDVSVVSFGNGKPIDAGSGGAVLTDDQQLATAVRELEHEVPVRDAKRLEKLYERYKNIYYAIEDAQEITNAASQLFEPIPNVFRELYMRGTSDTLPERVQGALATVDEEISARETNAVVYSSMLNHSSILHPDPQTGTVYYRYSIRLPSEKIRDDIVAYLRERDIHVSTLYDTIHRRFGSEADILTAQRLSRKTLNLWVSSDVDEEYAIRCCETVRSALKEYDSNVES